MRRVRWAILGALALVSVILIVGNRRPTPLPTPAPHQTRTTPRMEMKGFHYTGYDSEGRKVISIRGDRLTVEKKKIGFMRTALADQVIVRNATIDLYGDSLVPGSVSAPDPQKEPGGSGEKAGLVKAGVTFHADLQKECLTLFPGKRVASVLVEPLRLNLYGDGSLVAQIQASRASIRPIQRDFLFKGDVQVKAGDRTLTTEQLVLVPDGALIKTDRSFQYSSPTETKSGTSFRGDIFLNLRPTGT